MGHRRAPLLILESTDIAVSSASDTPLVSRQADTEDRTGTVSGTVVDRVALVADGVRRGKTPVGAGTGIEIGDHPELERVAEPEGR